MAPEGWFVGELQMDGRPVVVRARSALAPEPQRQGYPHLVLIAWPYTAGESGMPAPDEEARMQTFEAALDAGLEEHGVAIQAASLTGAGQKEWWYYAQAPDAFMNALDTGVQGHAPYPIEIQMLEDAEWLALQELLDAPGAVS